MNVATASQTVTQTTNSQSVQSKSSQTSSKSTDKSFDEELKTVSKQDEKVPEEKDSNKQEKTQKTETPKSKKTEDKHDDYSSSLDVLDSEIVNLTEDINFTDFKYHNESQSILTQNIQSLLNTKDLMSVIGSAETIDYDVVNISESDANFFVNLVKDGSISMENIAQDLNNTKEAVQNIKVSSVLMEKLSESMKTNKPFRIDFDKDISVIIKVNKDGSLSANFIPGDKAVEQYLRNNISSLKQRFDDENIQYSELSYSSSNNKEQQRHKKENNNE